MTTSSTAAYHHGNLREELVRQAVALAREKGGDGVVIREVARQAGVSHNAAYRHFADRSDLLAAVAEVGMLELAARMRERMDAPVRGTALRKAQMRLNACGRAYVGYALAEPGLFDVAFASANGPVPGEGPYELLSQALDGLLESGATTPDRRANAEILCWSAVHGFSKLCLEGPLRAAPADEREAALTDLLGHIEGRLIA